jgi:hypothetical protein
MSTVRCQLLLPPEDAQPVYVWVSVVPPEMFHVITKSVGTTLESPVLKIHSMFPVVVGAHAFAPLMPFQSY